MLLTPPLPFQCCQCCYIVKTKSCALQTPRKNTERRERAIKYSLPACKSRHSQVCHIRLSQLRLSMTVTPSVTVRSLKGAYFRKQPAIATSPFFRIPELVINDMFYLPFRPWVRAHQQAQAPLPSPVESQERRVKPRNSQNTIHTNSSLFITIS